MGNAVHVLEDLLSVQESSICKVVDYQGGKIHPEIGVDEASTWFRLWVERNEDVLPLTPSLSSQFARPPIGVPYQSVVGIDYALPGCPVCHLLKLHPSLWKNAPDRFGDPRHPSP